MHHQRHDALITHVTQLVREASDTDELAKWTELLAVLKALRHLANLRRHPCGDAGEEMTRCP